MHRYLIPVAVAAVLIALHAYPQGVWSHRFGAPDVNAEQIEFARRLKNVPTAFGDWESQEVSIGERELLASGSTGSFSRRFQNRLSPEKSVQVFIVCGGSRDVTQHTPDQCYVLSGFQEVETQDRHVIDTGKTVAEFSTNRFRKGASFEGPQHLRIFWSFSENGEWVAPNTPKFTLMHAPALYKLYAITEVPGDSSQRPDESAAVPFLREFVPVLTATLFPKEDQAPPPSTETASAAN